MAKSPRKSQNLRGVRHFEPGPGNKKYTAVLDNGKRVSFGDRRYEQYRDSVPKRLGGGLYSHLDHNDAKRRENYRRRHAGVQKSSGRRAIDEQYSPAWFSYHYLW